MTSFSVTSLSYTSKINLSLSNSSFSNLSDQKYAAIIQYSLKNKEGQSYLNFFSAQLSDVFLQTKLKGEWGQLNGIAVTITKSIGNAILHAHYSRAALLVHTA